MNGREAASIDRVLFAAVALAFVGAALYLLRDAAAFPTLRWIDMFSPYDYRREGLGSFLLDLRLPVPPVLAAIEMLSLRHLGSTWWIEVVLYRGAIIVAFLAALAVIWPSRLRLLLFLPLALVFVWAGALLNPFTPLVYDAVLPCLLLLYLFLHRWMHEARPDRAMVALPLAAGTVLALLELTRPFVLLLLPFFLLSAWAALRPHGRRAFLLLLLPLLLLSGAWHAHQFVRHGQVTWSNHAGFNLIRAWRQVPFPPLIDESPHLAAPHNQLPNANTETHSENSRRLQRAVLRYALDNPVEAAAHIGQRVAVFIGTGHFLEGVSPDHKVLAFYDVAVRYLDLMLLAGALAVAAAFVFKAGQRAAIVAAPANLALVVGAGALVIMAIGEAGEEARFQVSLLPLLAALPIPYLGRPRAAVTRRARQAATRWRAIGVAATILVLVAVEVVLWGSRRAPAGAAEGGPIMPPAQAAATPAEGRLRVVQASLHNAGGAQEPRVVAALARCVADSDVVGLTEVRGAGLLGREPDRATAFAARVGMAALFAPTERRWWHEHYGNALLTRLPLASWRREMLPRQIGYSHRGMLLAEVEVGGRRASVLVSHLDVYDRLVQLERLVERFRRIDGPAIMLADIGFVHPPPPPLAKLLVEPDVLAVSNRPTPEMPLMGRWIVARGFRLVGQSICPTGLSLHPELVADLVFAD